MTELPGRADVEAAHERIRPWIRRTPVVVAEPDATGVDEANVTLKLEGLQRSGSFKARGAFNSMLAQTVPAAGVITASGGNHGAAVAYAAMRLGHPATIFVPTISPAVKVERLKRYQAQVHQVGANYAEAYAAAMEHQARSGAMLVHAYDAPETLAGQGTVALEFEQQVAGLDTVIIAVGGGGLIGGVMAGLMGRGVKVVAVESTGTPTLARAMEAGSPVTVAVSGIAADSLGASRIGGLGFALAQAHLHATVLVTDDEIRAAQRRVMGCVAGGGGAGWRGGVRCGVVQAVPAGSGGAGGRAGVR